MADLGAITGATDRYIESDAEIEGSESIFITQGGCLGWSPRRKRKGGDI